MKLQELHNDVVIYKALINMLYLQKIPFLRININHWLNHVSIKKVGVTQNIKLNPVGERANVIRPYGILVEIKALLVIKIQHAEDVLEILIQKKIIGNIPKNTHIHKNTSGTHEGEPTRHSILGRNCARSSHLFESGFTGCIGLNIMVICL